MNIENNSSFDASPAFALGNTYRLLRRALDEALDGTHITTPQWLALGCVARNHDISGADMARQRHVTPQTMHGILLNLEQSGMIVREPHPMHGAVLRVLLTEEGRAVLEETMQRVETVQERMLSGLNDAERATLTSLLERCMHALQTHECADNHGPSCPR